MPHSGYEVLLARPTFLLAAATDSSQCLPHPQVSDSRPPSLPVLYWLNQLLSGPCHALCKSHSLNILAQQRLSALLSPWSWVLSINCSPLTDTCWEGATCLIYWCLLVLCLLFSHPLTPGVWLAKPTTSLSGLCSVSSLTPARVYWLHCSFSPRCSSLPISLMFGKGRWFPHLGSW